MTRTPVYERMFPVRFLITAYHDTSKSKGKYLPIELCTGRQQAIEAARECKRLGWRGVRLRRIRGREAFERAKRLLREHPPIPF